MNQRDVRIRRSKILWVKLEDFSQAEIAKRLGVSQPTVSRDLQAVDRDKEELSKFVEGVGFRFSIAWQAYSENDAALKRASEDYSRMDTSDLKARFEGLSVITGLLGRKVYLLAYMGSDPVDPYRDDHHRAKMVRRFQSLKKSLDELDGEVPGPSFPQPARDVKVA